VGLVGGDVTLEEAKRAFFEEAKQDGAVCPCCERFGKVYKRKLHSSMVAVLLLLYRHRSLGFVHVHTLINQMSDPRVAAAIRGDFAKLRYWGLIEEGFEVQENEDKKHNGTWRITENGCLFAEGKLRVYSRIWLYNTKYLGVADYNTVDVHEALRDKFSYRELMGL